MVFARLHFLLYLSLLVYVDDCLAIGNHIDITSFRQELSEYFTTTAEDSVEDFTGCTFTYNEYGIKIHQPVLLANIDSTLQHKIDIPAPQHQVLKANNEDETFFIKTL